MIYMFIKIIHHIYHTIRIIVCVSMNFTYSFCLHTAVPDRNNEISLVLLHFDIYRLNDLIICGIMFMNIVLSDMSRATQKGP